MFFELKSQKSLHFLNSKASKIVKTLTMLFIDLFICIIAKTETIGFLAQFVEQGSDVGFKSRIRLEFNASFPKNVLLQNLSTYLLRSLPIFLSPLYDALRKL